MTYSIEYWMCPFSTSVPPILGDAVINPVIIDELCKIRLNDNEKALCLLLFYIFIICSGVTIFKRMIYFRNRKDTNDEKTE